jgi:hypothetical protein
VIRSRELFDVQEDQLPVLSIINHGKLAVRIEINIPVFINLKHVRIAENLWTNVNDRLQRVNSQGTIPSSVPSLQWPEQTRVWLRTRRAFDILNVNHKDMLYIKGKPIPVKDEGP